MEINFKRENSGSYMEICGEPETDSFEMKMMCSNNITGFLPVSVRQINNKARNIFKTDAIIRQYRGVILSPRALIILARRL